MEPNRSFGMGKVTSILLSWKRPRNLSLISRELSRSPRVDEILVWNNNVKAKIRPVTATVINAPRNFFCLPRYCLVPLAKNETIWFQDDDVLLTADQFEIIFHAYLRDPTRIYGIRGRNLDSEGRYLNEPVIGECDIILGQAMLFHRSLVSHMFDMLGKLPPITVEDDVVFSLSCKKRHLVVSVGTIADLGSDDAVALWRQPNHFEKRQKIVDLVRKSQEGPLSIRPRRPPGLAR
jgi:hypothetical protein